MKKYYFLIIVVLILGLALAGCTFLSNIGQIPTNEQSGITYLTKGPPGKPNVFTLYAGQHIDVGTVSVWNDCESLYIKYETTDDWVMTETHLAVVITTYRNFPRTKTGNPKVGKFPYKCCYDETEEEWLFVQKPDTLSGTCDADGKEDATLTEITYTIPLTWGIGAELFIAAHAVVEKQIEGEIIQEETAWGEGTRFVKKGNWATYFEYKIENLLPTISSEDLADPFTAGVLREFHVKTVNPSCGLAYSNVLFNYIIEGISTSEINTFEYKYYDEVTSGWKWGEMPKENDGSGNVTGFFGPLPDGFPLTVPYTAETKFRINITTPGTYTVIMTLNDRDNGDAVLATFTEDVVVSPETVLAVGDNYGGGIVAYILKTGESNGVYSYDANVQHGLIAATTDQSTVPGTEWGCYGASISGADGTAVGTGKQNTIDIEVGCTTVGTAADICANLSLGSYDDWFLPSKDELNKLYLNKGAIGDFADYPYWSSSEYGAYRAWYQGFDYGNKFVSSKASTYPVRAVRAF